MSENPFKDLQALAKKYPKIICRRNTFNKALWAQSLDMARMGLKVLVVKPNGHFILQADGSLKKTPPFERKRDKKLLLDNGFYRAIEEAKEMPWEILGNFKKEKTMRKT